MHGELTFAGRVRQQPCLQADAREHQRDEPDALALRLDRSCSSPRRAAKPAMALATAAIAAIATSGATTESAWR